MQFIKALNRACIKQVSKGVRGVFIVALAATIPVAAYAQCVSPSAVAGAREWFPGDLTYKVCDGTNWVDKVCSQSTYGVCDTLGACTIPGELDYDGAENAYKMCDGSDWLKMGCEEIPGCDTTPQIFNTPTTDTYTVPPGCDTITVQAYGAGGGGANNILARGAGGGGGAAAVVRVSDSQVIVIAGGGGGGGGVEGTLYTSSRGGGGGYAQSTLAVAAGANFNVFIPGGGLSPTNDTGANGGAGVAPYPGGRGGNRRANGTGAVNGGAGGGGAENNGGSSTYGGAGGRGDDGGVCGTSTNGGACSNQHGGGGGGYSFNGGTVTIGGNGGAGGGTAAAGGPGNGVQTGTAGGGRVVITASSSVGGCVVTCEDLGACSVEGQINYFPGDGILGYCDGSRWISLKDGVATGC